MARHAISEDGSRVFWTNSAGNQLYLRANIGQPQSPIENGKCSVPSDACTIQIGQLGQFQDASSDGSRVFYSQGGSDRGLFECEIPADLECDPVRLGEGFGRVSVIGSTEDGSYLYWIAANRDLYEDHLVGGEWHLRLIAVLSATDVSPFTGPTVNLGYMTARVSPDGQWLAFMSNRPLTGYDNRDLNSGEPDQEVFLYHAGSGGGAGSLACASCNPTGARPVGEPLGFSLVSPGEAGPEGWLSAVLPGWVPFEGAPPIARYQPRYLSNEGRLFFDSDDALVPKDINENWDVYEYEPEGFKNPEGTHPCTSASTSGSVVYRPGRAFQVPAEGAVPAVEGEEGAGCVGLISSGESAQESALLDASESGGDVFFMTTAKLAPQDFDEAYDVYDAHECTASSPCIPNPASPPPACVTADACRTAPTPQPGVYGAPASATFNGIGNLTPAAPVVVKKKTAAQVRAEDLKKALKKCRTAKKKKKRATCEKSARKRYGPAKKASRGNK